MCMIGLIEIVYTIPSAKDSLSLPSYRHPHHSASAVSLIGGGTNPKPGEVSLAHRGVLFLDELEEFSKKTLDMLRQPLENAIPDILFFPKRAKILLSKGFERDSIKRLTERGKTLNG
jgi:predicted ATPase with chaperone activity